MRLTSGMLVMELGMGTLFSIVQSLNVPCVHTAPSRLKHGGALKAPRRPQSQGWHCAKGLHEGVRLTLPIIVTESGMVTLVKLEQP